MKQDKNLKHKEATNFYCKFPGISKGKEVTLKLLFFLRNLKTLRPLIRKLKSFRNLVGNKFGDSIIWFRDPGTTN